MTKIEKEILKYIKGYSKIDKRLKPYVKVHLENYYSKIEYGHVPGTPLKGDWSQLHCRILM